MFQFGSRDSTAAGKVNVDPCGQWFKAHFIDDKDILIGVPVKYATLIGFGYIFLFKSVLCGSSAKWSQ